MSACDTCPAPGSCCRSIVLGGGSFARDCQTVEEAEAFIRGSADGSNSSGIRVAGNPLPFHPLYKGKEGAWRWWCPNLDRKTGRCGDYENRPMACSDYQPGSDPLCVLHVPEAEHG